MQLRKFNQWLCANKLSLKIDKSNFVIFRPPQKKIEYTVKLQINNKIIEERKCIKYLGIFIDCHLNWKEHVHELSKEIARGIGILSKLRHFVSQAILVQVYYCSQQLWLHSSVGRALHRYRRGHGFESR